MASSMVVLSPKVANMIDWYLFGLLDISSLPFAKGLDCSWIWKFVPLSQMKDFGGGESAQRKKPLVALKI